MQIIGIYNYPTTSAQIEEAVIEQWGDDIPPEERNDYRLQTQDHFDNLYLVECRLDKPPGDDFDWGAITQEGDEEQVPYDEQQVETDPSHWVFFFHFLDISKPFTSPDGDIPLPAPSPLPEHLASVEYFLP